MKKILSKGFILGILLFTTSCSYTKNYIYNLGAKNNNIIIDKTKADYIKHEIDEYNLNALDSIKVEFDYFMDTTILDTFSGLKGKMNMNGSINFIDDTIPRMSMNVINNMEIDSRLTGSYDVYQDIDCVYYWEHIYQENSTDYYTLAIDYKSAYQEIGPFDSYLEDLQINVMPLFALLEDFDKNTVYTSNQARFFMNSFKTPFYTLEYKEEGDEKYSFDETLGKMFNSENLKNNLYEDNDGFIYSVEQGVVINHSTYNNNTITTIQIFKSEMKILREEIKELTFKSEVYTNGDYSGNLFDKPVKFMDLTGSQTYLYR